MHPHAVMSCLVILSLVTLYVQDVTSLPPDFFRAGRGGKLERDSDTDRVPSRPSSYDNKVILQIICSYCQGLEYKGLSSVEEDCLSSVLDSQLFCAGIYLNHLKTTANSLRRNIW